MHFKNIFFGMILMLQTGGAFAEEVVTSYTKSENNNLTYIREIEDIKEYRLKNGLQILLMPDIKEKNVVVNLTYRVGAKNESTKGIAHVLEHMLMTQASLRHQNLEQELKVRHFKRLGITSADYTYYRSNFDAKDNSLNWLLDVEAERMQTFPYSKGNLQIAINEVAEEESINKTDVKRVQILRTLASVFPQHLYGAIENDNNFDDANITLEKVQEFWNTYYSPNNATLLIAGNFDPEQTLQAINNAFADIPNRHEPLKTLSSVEKYQQGDREFVFRNNKERSKVIVAYRTESIAQPTYAAIPVIANILTNDTDSGRWEKSFLLSENASLFKSYLVQFTEASVLMFDAALNFGDSKKIHKTKSHFLLQESYLKNKKFTQNELNEAKKIIDTEYINERKDIVKFSENLSLFIAGGDWRLYFTLRDRIKKLRLNELQKISDSLIAPRNHTFTIFIEN